MKNVADAIIITNSKKNNLVNELMGAGATAAIVSGVCMVTACIIKCTTEFGYEATSNEAMDSISKVWKALEESVNKKG